MRVVCSSAARIDRNRVIIKCLNIFCYFILEKVSGFSVKIVDTCENIHILVPSLRISFSLRMSISGKADCMTVKIII